MPEYRFLLQDASSTGLGGTVAEVALNDVTFTTLLSDVGSLTGSLPLSDPKAVPANFLLGQRDVTVLRDGVCVFNGPLTRASRNLQTRQLEITAREVPWILGKRTVEVDKNYNADLFAIVRDLLVVTKGKTNGGLHRFTASTGSSGVTKAWAFSGYGRRVIRTILDDLAADNFDYRMEYSVSGEAVTRLLALGAPTLGVTRGNVVEPGAGLVDLGLDEDLDRACNRAHVIGANALVHTSTNAASYAAGDTLLEEVFDRADVTSSQVIVSTAQDRARRLKPPLRIYQAVWTPTAALPYGFALPGDTVTLSAPALGVTSVSQRVIGVETKVTPEEVTLLFADTT